MSFRHLACALLLLTLAACQTPYQKSDAAEKKAKKDFSKDPTFQAFAGRLRIAVNKHDRKMLASMMTDDFGYRWDNAPPGETAFDYWDQRKLWGELGGILQQKFVPNDADTSAQYMVAPPQMMTDANYQGYRVGVRLVRGSWRFAYFVPAPPPQQPAAPPPARQSALPGEPDLGSRAAQ
jgi:hypothetical protein